MKRNISILLVVVVQLIASNIWGQTLYTKTDSISLKSDTIVKLILPTHRGNVQWEKSLDNTNWFDINGQTSDSMKIMSEDEALYRAKVIDGACNPIYTDSVLVSTKDTITKNVVDVSSKDLNLISDSTQISDGEYIYTGKDTTADFEIGKIIVDEQSGGTIRKISEISQNGDTISVKTDQATMEDLFKNTSFKLSTDMVYPTQNLKSANLIQIEKALTDNDGYIHPVEIKYESPNGLQLKSVSVFQGKSEKEGGTLYMHKDWSGTTFYDLSGEFKLPNKQGINVSYSGNVKSYISEGFFTFDPIFKFEFEFDRPTIKWKNFKITKGEITKFKFYSDRSLIEFKNVLAFESNISYEFGKEWTLVPNIINAKFKFIVGGVPIWVDFKIDVDCSLNAEFSSGVVTTQGFQNSNFITIGADYENKNWSIIKDIEKDNQVIASNTGFSSNGVHFEIYPSVEMKLYGIVGPNFKVGPYINYESTVSNSGNWDKKIDIGMDSNLGVSVDVFGREIASLDAVSWRYFEVNLWKAPNNLEIVTGNNQTAGQNRILPNPVVVQVFNSLKIPLDNVPVHFSATNGSVSQTTVKTDSNGLAQTNWTLSEDIGEQNLKVYVLDGKDMGIDGCSQIVKATAIQAGSAPGADFIASKTSVTKGQSIQFTDKSTNTPTSWQWNFGDGATSTSQNPTHIYNTVGNYTISLKVTNEYGSNTKTMANYITVTQAGSAPVADFTVSQNPGTVGQAIQLTDKSTNSPTSWLWNFGDGNTSTTQNPSHIYNTAGTYTVSLKATNSYGNSTKSLNITIDQGGETVTDIDGNVYHTVTIGTQVWMVENLKTTKFNDGTSIPNVTVDTDWDNLITSAYCWCKNDISFKTPYGALYNWYTVSSGKVAPIGWHVPSKVDWTTLINFLGDETNAGGKLKETGITHWNSPNSGATNESGFTALAGGGRDYDWSIGNNGLFWSSTMDDNGNPWYLNLRNDLASLQIKSTSKFGGFSVRCIKDSETSGLPPSADFSISSNTVTVGESIQFADQSTNIPTSWLWNFGDGSASADQNPSHTYNTAGTYSVSLTATNSYGNNIKSMSITVNEAVETVTDIDGNVYHTVKIGTQVWMVENLKTTKYNDGTSISYVTDNNTWSDLSTGAYCWYNNDMSNKDPFGALYNGYVINSGNLCPNGWHIPSENEWSTLISYLGGESVAGGKMKEAGNAHWELSPDVVATNSSGFTALPSLHRGWDGSFNDVPGRIAFWWSSTLFDSNTLWVRSMGSSTNYFGKYTYYGFKSGFSVRCIKD